MKITTLIVIAASTALLLLIPACSVSTFGKFQYEQGVPSFIKVGETTRVEVFEKLGEPLGYRERNSRSVMTYEYVRDDYLWLVFGAYSQERAYRLYTVFENGVLAKAEVQRDGWGFAGNVDPQMVQLLIR